MSNRGFKGFRKPSKISAESLDLAIKRMGVDGRFIYWTGNPYRARSASLRSNSLAALKTPKRPVPLADWIKMAARVVDADKGIGYDPARVREGLYLHRDSKPAVFFELKKDEKGNFISVNHVPNADGFPKGLKSGDIVIPAKGASASKGKASKGKNLPKVAVTPTPTTPTGEQPQA
jgi:hypothetical protein